MAPVVLSLCLVVVLQILASEAFVGPAITNPSPLQVRPERSLLWASQSADFEYQEMKIVLTAMQTQGISQIQSSKEMEDFVRTVARERPSERPQASSLPGTTWKLVFSTDPAVRSGLPAGAAVVLNFTGDATMEYNLEFAKTLGMNKMTALSKWDLTESGILKYTYDKITTNVFGMTVDTGLFGLLKGRTSYVTTSYFDGKYWIEVLEGGVNVFVLQEDTEDEWNR